MDVKFGVSIVVEEHRFMTLRQGRCYAGGSGERERERQ